MTAGNVKWDAAGGDIHAIFGAYASARCHSFCLMQVPTKTKHTNRLVRRVCV